MIVPSPPRTLVLRSALLVLGAGGLAWAVAIGISGGIILNTSWGRISSRNPVNPFLIGALALVCYVAAFRQHAEADVRRVSAVLRPQRLALLLAAAALVVGIRWGTFVASGSDASGYVSQAEMWLRGTLTTLAPEWARDAPWQDAGATSAPLGYRPSEISYVIVPTYSPGLPLIMALFQAVGGPDAVYYVVPCFGALAVWMTYLLGARFAGPWAGLLGALLILTSPTFLFMLVQPMSDVPAAALWGVALWAASRDGTPSASTPPRKERAAGAPAAGAGAAVAMAILTRPNIAPLAAVVVLIMLYRPSARLRDLFWFTAAAAPGAIAIAALNTFWYGSPVNSGYGSLDVLYSIDRVWPNLVLYAGWLFESETPLMLAGLALPFIVAKTSSEARLMILVAIVFPAAVLALYLPYFVFETWLYLRFLLPAYVPLLAASGAVIVTIVRRVPRPVPAAALAVLVVAAVALHGIRYSPAFRVEDAERRYTRVVEFVRELPPRAVFLSLLHSGSIRYYTGRDILRWDLVAASSLDTAIAHIRSRGYDIYFVGDPPEVSDFKKRFANSRVVRELDGDVPIDVGDTLIFPLDGSAGPDRRGG
jgi:hypothetical protein